jgi:hypothetical protein
MRGQRLSLSGCEGVFFVLSALHWTCCSFVGSSACHCCIAFVDVALLHTSVALPLPSIPVFRLSCTVPAFSVAHVLHITLMLRHTVRRMHSNAAEHAAPC